MTELIRDTILGHTLRLITGKRVLLYEEEKQPEIWQKYVNNGTLFLFYTLKNKNNY